MFKIADKKNVVYLFRQTMVQQNKKTLLTIVVVFIAFIIGSTIAVLAVRDNDAKKEDQYTAAIAANGIECSDIGR